MPKKSQLYEKSFYDFAKIIKFDSKRVIFGKRRRNLQESYQKASKKKPEQKILLKKITFRQKGGKMR